MLRVPPEDRRFYSTVLLATVPLQVTFGWLFLMAGTGQWLLLSGVLTGVAGVTLSLSAWRTLAALAGLVLGCWPIGAILLWFAVR